jgi:hypothetical protein
VLLQDSPVTLEEPKLRSMLSMAVMHNLVDLVEVLLPRFPLDYDLATYLIGYSIECSRSEILKVILKFFDPQEHDEEEEIEMLEVEMLEVTVRESIPKALRHGHHQFVWELVTRPTNLEKITGILRRSLTLSGNELLVELASTHVDELHVLLDMFGPDLEDDLRRTLMQIACRYGSADLVQKLLDNHQDQFGDWDVGDFNGAAVHGNMPVLRLLSSSRYGGCKKLTEKPPLNRISTRRVFRELHAESSVMLMWCIKNKTTADIMAKLLDVLRDFITNSLSYETE